MKYLLLSVFLLPILSMGQSSDKDQILAVVDDFFKLIDTKDTSLMKQILHPDGQFFRADEDGTITRTTHQSYIERLGAGKGKWIERYWDAEVRVRGGIATFWAPYDFYVNGKFSHCGIDAMDFVNINGKWIIAGGLYTMEREGCSSLNLPKRE